MIIWLFALLLLGLLALIGFYSGAIRVTVSLIGLFVSALLAMPLSPVLKPVLPVLGWKHPLWKEILPPVIIFILLMIVFKIIGAAVHRKVSVFYKYKRDDKTRLKWERLNRRVGACVGAMNGAVYFVLLLIPFYVAGYLTTQLASGEEDTKGMRFINETRREIQAAKVDKVVAAYDPAPAGYYEAADIIGLLKNNPLLSSRLAHYPVFLSLAETKEFQDIATDVQLNEMIQTQAKISDILNYPKVQAVLTNATITAQMAQLLGSDLKDLHEYLKTGKSAKYDDEQILGLWTLNFNATAAQERVANPKITPLQLRQLKQTKYAPLFGMTFAATTEKKVILKKAPPASGGPAEVIAQGEWKAEGSGYDVSMGGKSVKVTFEKGRMFVPQEGMTLVFDKEN
ncbi:MAG: CvpA family protein [Verrucomicrobiota bacterium]